MSGFAFPTGIIFQQYVDDRQGKEPKLEVIEGTTKFEHGTYQTQPYYTFIRSKTGKLYLISDTGLRAELTYIGSPTTNKKKALGGTFKLSFENLAKPVNYPDAILVYQPLECENEPSDYTFLVRGTDLAFAFLPQGEHPFGQYTVSLPRLANDKGNTIEWGSPFAPKQAGFDLLLQSWDLTEIDPTNIAAGGNVGQVLEPPNGQTFNYDQPGGHIVVPYGWSFRYEPITTENDAKNMVTSSVDMMNSVQKAAGFHIAGGVTASVPGVFEASADFSVTRSTSAATMLGDMYEGQKIFGVTESITRACAFVLDKRNVQLSEDFKQAVTALRLEMDKHPGGVLPEEMIKGSVKTRGFIQAWGTHYIYGATFGERTIKTTTYTKEHVTKLINEKLDVKQAWTAGAKATVFGIGGHLEGGQDTEEAKEAQRQFEEATEHQTGVSVTVGGPAGTAPIYVDLRPLSDLLGPPFYTDEAIAITLRDQIAAALPVYAFTRELPPKLGGDGGEDAITFYKLEFCSLEVRVTSIQSEGMTFSGEPEVRLEPHPVGDSYMLLFPFGSLVSSSVQAAGNGFLGKNLGASAVVYTLKSSIPVQLALPVEVAGSAPMHIVGNPYAGESTRSTGQSLPISQVVQFSLSFDVPLTPGDHEIPNLTGFFTIAKLTTTVPLADPKHPGSWPTNTQVVVPELRYELQLAPFMVTVSKVNLKSAFGISA